MVIVIFGREYLILQILSLQSQFSNVNHSIWSAQCSDIFASKHVGSKW